MKVHKTIFVLILLYVLTAALQVSAKPKLSDTIQLQTGEKTDAVAVVEEAESLDPAVIINKDNIRGVLSNLQQIHFQTKPQIPDEIRDNLVFSQPLSGDALLSIIENRSDELQYQATKVLVYIWESLSRDQMAAYFKLAIEVSVDSHQRYAMGDGTTIGTRYGTRYSGCDIMIGWPKVKGLKTNTVTQNYLDKKPYGKPLHRQRHVASTGWIAVDELPLGKHSIQAVTEYTITYKKHTFSDKIKSDVVEFEVISKQAADKLAAPHSKELEKKVNSALTFSETKRETEGRWFSRKSDYYMPPDPWEPQVASIRGNGKSEYSIHTPLFSISNPLDVDLCFDVEAVVIKSGEKFKCYPIIIHKGQKIKDRYIHISSSDFEKGRKGFIPVKFILTPSRKLALNDKGITQYYNSSITSKVLRAKVSRYDYSTAKPWERQLADMYDSMSDKGQIDRQAFYRFQAMGSLNPYQRSNAPNYLINNKNQVDIELAIPFIVKLLNGNEGKPGVRRFGNTDEEKAHYNLIQMLQGTAYQAHDALVKIGGPAVPELIKSLKENNDGGRALAVEALASIDDKRAYKPIVELLKDAGPKSKQAIARSLGKFKNADSVFMLIDLLKDDDDRIRYGAALSLVAVGDKKAVSPLIDCLEDSDYQVRQTAVEALAVMQPDDSVELFFDRLKKDDNTIVRRIVIEKLADIDDSRIIDKLIEAALADKAAEVRSAAVRALYRKRGKRALEAIIICLEDPEQQVRSAAVSSLGQINDPAGIAPLIKALKDESRNVRFMVVEALGKSKSLDAVQPLIEILNDNDKGVRSHAVRVLGNIGDQRAVEPAILLLKDEDSNLRYEAAEALGKLKDPRAIEPLKPLLVDKYTNVRSAAKTSIEQIQEAQKEKQLKAQPPSTATDRKG